MPLDPENRKLLSSAGIVVCLRSSAQAILTQCPLMGAARCLKATTQSSAVDSYSAATGSLVRVICIPDEYYRFVDTRFR